MSAQLPWYVVRASGVLAWLLCVLSVLWGLALSTRALGRKPTAPWLLDLHRFLGGLSIAFVGVHLLSLWLDNFVQFGPAQLFVPLASSWHPVAVAWGVVAFYVLVAVEVSSLAMRYLPRRWWRGIHFSSFAVYVLVTVHVLTAGTDRRVPILRWTAFASVVGVVFLTVYRILSSPAGAWLGGESPSNRRQANAANREAMLEQARRKAAAGSRR